MSNVTCPAGNFLPELSTISIPHNTSVIVIPGSNASDAAMVNCCFPQPVAVADSCYEWCEVQDNMTLMEFNGCLLASGKTTNVSNIVGLSSDSVPGPSATTLLKLGLWTLLVSGAATLL
ncbi:hypothetical protein F503_02535 [Ophiostoma piceae UAMH 11346]|uniref:Uncharacterized protein n=1 Tax=Ophiostoma piceae (strain UAMH 11346) TaxID=1262450 RepID=S3C0Z4_OPHP1|nr:hypothetical protein F503_02535 [Ophiostoma piceae UAMH 11346]